MAQEKIETEVSSLSWDLSDLSTWERAQHTFGQIRLPFFRYEDPQKILEPTANAPFAAPLIWSDGQLKIASPHGRYQFKWAHEDWQKLPPQLSLQDAHFLFSSAPQNSQLHLSVKELSVVDKAHWLLGPLLIESHAAQEMPEDWAGRFSLILDSLWINRDHPSTSVRGEIPLDQSALSLNALLGTVELKKKSARFDFPTLTIAHQGGAFALSLENTSLFCSRSPWQAPWPVTQYLLECLNQSSIEDGADRKLSEFTLNLALKNDEGQSYSLQGKIHQIKMDVSQGLALTHVLNWQSPDWGLDLYNANFECSKTPWESSTWNFPWEMCINQNRLWQHLPTQPVTLRVHQGPMRLQINAKTWQSKPRSFALSAEDFTFNNPTLSLHLEGNFPEYEKGAKFRPLKLGCLKRPFGKDFEGKNILVDCFTSSQVQIPSLELKLKKKDFGLKARMEAISLDQETLFVSGPLLTLYSSEIEARMENLSLYCHKMPFTKDSPYKNIFLGCLKKSWSDITDIHVCRRKENMPCNRSYLIESDEDFQLDIQTRKVELDEENVELTGDRLNFTSKKFYLSLDGVNLKCKNEQLMEMVDDELSDDELGDHIAGKSKTKKSTVDRILKGCFDTSIVDVQGITLRSSKFAADLNIKSVHLDKGRILLNLPRAKYSINGDLTEIEGIDLYCGLNAKIEDLTGLEWKNVLENCLNRTNFQLKKLAAVSTDLIDIGVSQIQDLKLSVKNHRFTLLVTAVLAPLGKEVNVEVVGKIDFTQNKEKIHLTIETASIIGSILPLKMPIKKFLMPFILGHFFEEKYLEQISDEEYFIILPKDDEVAPSK